MRRRSGQPDVSFPKSWLSEYEKARSLKERLIIANCDLSIEEARILEVSAGIKLLETAGYRPFEVELEDCSLIGRTYKLLSSGFAVKSKMICIRLSTGTSVKLIRGGKFMLAYRLCPASLYPLVALRFMLRFAMPKYVIAAIHKTSST
jgi:hypothetical protein